MNNILVVEDDEILSEGIKASLENQNTEVTQADCIKSALDRLGKAQFDLAVLDVNLPDGNGYQLCKTIKERWDIPIIFLTARDMESDVVLGLESGADDYITKPFSLRILQARIDAVLRRIGKGAKETRIVVGSLKIDFEHMIFEKDGQKLLLSMTEQKLLKVLLLNQGNAVVNYTDAETPYTRVIEHKHFEFGTQEKTVISREYSAEWKLGDEPYYPVNDEKNSALYVKYKALAEGENGVIFGGRLGEYQYYDMDKVVEVALARVQAEMA